MAVTLVVNPKLNLSFAPIQQKDGYALIGQWHAQGTVVCDATGGDAQMQVPFTFFRDRYLFSIDNWQTRLNTAAAIGIRIACYPGPVDDAGLSLVYSHRHVTIGEGGVGYLDPAIDMPPWLGQIFSNFMGTLTGAIYIAMPNTAAQEHTHSLKGSLYDRETYLMGRADVPAKKIFRPMGLRRL